MTDSAIDCCAANGGTPGPGDIEANIMSLDRVSSTSRLLAMRSWSARLLFLSALLISLLLRLFSFPMIADVAAAAADEDDIDDNEFGMFVILRLDGFSVNIISSAEHGCMAGARRSRLGKSRS